MSVECDKLFEKDIQEYLKYYKNDKEKLNDLIIKHEKLFYKMYHSYSYYANGMDKDDCMQLIYLKLLDAIEKYNPESGSYFFSYLYASVKNTFLMRGRDYLKFKKYCNGLEYLDEPIPGVEELTKGDAIIIEENGFDLVEFNLTMKQILNLLDNDKDKETFDMIVKVYYDGRTQEDVASEYNISQSMISKRMSRLIKKIKNKIR